MKKLLYLALAFWGAITMTSCLGDDNTVDDFLVWNEQNVAFFQAKSDSVNALGDTVYTKLYSQRYPSLYILYRELEAPDSATARIPYYSSTVEIAYSGTLFNDDTPFDESESYTSQVRNFVSGFTLALENMREGAKWEIILPQELGYGSAAQGTIPPYSVLIFDLELKDIVQYETGTNPDEEDQ